MSTVSALLQRARRLSFVPALLLISSALWATPPFKTPAPRAAYSGERARLSKPPSPCVALAKKLLELGGSQAIACSKAASLSGAIDCANKAIHERRPFTLCGECSSFDSLCEEAVVGLPNGNVLKLEYDSRGPAFYGTCLRQDVSTAADQWPQCRTTLVDQTDIRTNHPYQENSSTEGEAWPAACASDALRAINSIRPVLLEPRPSIMNPQRDCDSSPVKLELLVSEEGRVKCARVVDPALPEKVRDEIMSELALLRFAPAQMNGAALAVRLSFTIPKPCVAP